MTERRHGTAAQPYGVAVAAGAEEDWRIAEIRRHGDPANSATPVPTSPGEDMPGTSKTANSAAKRIGAVAASLSVVATVLALTTLPAAADTGTAPAVPAAASSSSDSTPTVWFPLG